MSGDTLMDQIYANVEKINLLFKIILSQKQADVASDV